jgi:hypothetical protein
MTTKNKAQLRKIKKYNSGRIDTVSALIDRLGNAYIALERAEAPLEQVKVLHGTAAQLFSGGRLLIEAAKARKERPNSPFLK